MRKKRQPVGQSKQQIGYWLGTERKMDGKKVWISIEGTIGAGKSTVMEKLKGEDFFIAEEPVSKVGPLLELYYTNPKTFAFIIQCRFFAERIKTIRQSLSQSDFIVSERSPITDYLFWNVQLKQNHIDSIVHSVYHDMWTEWQNLLDNRSPTMFIYLKCSLDTSMTRIHTRNRAGEDQIKEEYQKTIIDEHDSMFSGSSVAMPNGTQVPCFTIDAEQSTDEIVEQIKKLINVYV